MTKREITLSDTPCPRCGCHNIGHFDCNCGEVHDDYCDNCGRWVSLPKTEHLELSQIDAPCAFGAIEHAHDPEEKCQRIASFYANPARDGRGAKRDKEELLERLFRLAFAHMAKSTARRTRVRWSYLRCKARSIRAALEGMWWDGHCWGNEGCVDCGKERA